MDNLIFRSGNDCVMLKEFKKSTIVEFEMSDHGMMHYFLGMKVVQSDNGILTSKTKHVQNCWQLQHNVLCEFSK